MCPACVLSSFQTVSPDSAIKALDVAKIYNNRIDTIYVGPDGGGGSDFLERLACQSGGETATAEHAAELAETTRFLLTRG